MTFFSPSRVQPNFSSSEFSARQAQRKVVQIKKSMEFSYWASSTPWWHIQRYIYRSAPKKLILLCVFFSYFVILSKWMVWTGHIPWSEFLKRRPTTRSRSSSEENCGGGLRFKGRASDLPINKQLEWSVLIEIHQDHDNADDDNIPTATH